MKVDILDPVRFEALSAEDRAEIADALYRFCVAQDIRDREMLGSTFTKDATLDFTQPARRFGVQLPILEGRQQIIDTIFETIGDLDTTHSAANLRVTAYDGREAKLFALVEAQHLLMHDHSRYLLLKNIYTLDLARSGKQWAIKSMVIDLVWSHGDASVLFFRGSR